jgi:hypothetical protein
MVHVLVQLYKLGKVNGRNSFSDPVYGELVVFLILVNNHKTDIYRAVPQNGEHCTFSDTTVQVE